MVYNEEEKVNFLHSPDFTKSWYQTRMQTTIDSFSIDSVILRQQWKEKWERKTLHFVLTQTVIDTMLMQIVIDKMYNNIARKKSELS